MPRFADDDDEYGGADSVESRPGIWQSLRSYIEFEYTRSGDPRQRMLPHDDGGGGVCRGGCDHVMPPSSDPENRAVRMLADYHAGEPVVVPHHIACGQRWHGNGWTDPEFDLPWAAREVRHVLIAVNDTASPA